MLVEYNKINKKSRIKKWIIISLIILVLIGIAAFCIVKFMPKKEKRLVKESSYLMDELSYTISYTYDDNGNVIEKTYNDGEDFLNNEIYEYDENGNVIEYWYYDWNGNMSTHVKYKYVYTNDNRLLGKETYTTDNILIRYDEYNEYGDTIYTVQYKDDKISDTMEYINTYDKNGNILTSYCEFLGTENEYIYDENNNLLDRYMRFGATECHFTYIYDSDGYKIWEYTYNSSGTLIIKVFYEYE